MTTHLVTPEAPASVDLAPLERLTRDVRDTARLADTAQARALVDFYYQLQELRKATGNQARSLGRDDEPNALAEFFAGQMGRLEDQVASALDVWTKDQPVADWCRAQYGVGPIITAGLLAHIDITQAPTVGHIWRFAGLDPSVRWGKGEKRPWNAALKTLCWKLGDSFVKFHNADDCFYGHLYAERKALEVERNEQGRFADQAADKLATTNIRDKATRAVYEAGRLPDGRLDLRARRWAVKIFLAHLHEVWFYEHYGTAPPKPYVLENVPGHAHKISPPHWAPPA